MKTKQSPLEALQAKKQQLRFDAYAQQDKISANIQYMQHNGVKLVLNSIASAILPGSFTAQNDHSGISPRSLGITDLAIGGISSVMKGNKGFLPIIWNFARPFILTWGIKGIKRLFRRKKG